MPEQVTYKSFLRLIEDMVENRESGVLYLRTDRNRSVFVGIRNGKIETLVSGLRRGAKAIKTILDMSSGSYRRDNATLALDSGDLPPTTEILQILKDRDAELDLDEPTVPLESVFEEADASIDSQHALKILCDLLHDYIGPVAPIICEDITQGGARLSNASELDDLIMELADEVDSDDEAREFIQRAQTSLKG